MTFSAGPVEGRFSVFVTFVNLNIGVPQEKLDNIFLSACTGLYECRIIVRMAFIDGVNVDLFLHQC
jgi:hypothetical protein